MAFQAEPVIRKEIATSYALWLYQHERVTLAKAAKLSGLDRDGFMLVCKDHRVPVIDFSRTDLLEDLSGFKVA